MLKIASNRTPPVAAPRALRRNRLAHCILMALGTLPAGPLLAAPSSAPQKVEFSPGFLGNSARNIDLSRFERGNPMLPGEWRVDLYVNQYLASRERVVFRADDAKDQAQPCFDRAQLAAMGVDTLKLEAAGADLGGDCLNLERLIPDASVAVDASELRLDISIPQVALVRNPRGYTDPKLWDRGLNAFTLGYNFNAAQSESNRQQSRDAYLGLDAGLNVGGWRLRNQSNVRWTNGNGSESQNIRTYAQHDVDPLGSQLTIGDTFTSGQVFDSVGVRGVSLATDDRMRPDSMNGYAPVVRGVAETHARVLVRQAGYVIYETNVAPGNFELTDLSATGFGGDLDVTVIEADGRERSFRVPFAAVPNLLRPGISRYAVTAGQVRNAALVASSPTFLEATYQRGLNNLMTGYAGVQSTSSSLYRSAVVGAAFNTPAGAVSLDVTGSQTHLSGQAGEKSGYSTRATYSKSIPQTHTDFALAAYRFSSRGYLGLDDAVRLDDLVRSSLSASGAVEDFARQRSRFQLTLSQSLGEGAGQLYVSGSRSQYWTGQSDWTSYNIGYSNRYRSLSYSVSATRSRLADGRSQDTFYVNLSIPLGNTTAGHRAPTLSMQGSHSPQGNGLTTSVAGNFGERDQYQYGVNGNVGSAGPDSVAVSAGWQAPYATLGGSYTQGTGGTRQTAVSASGGMVVHAGGVTLAPQLGDTIGLIEAQGAQGAHLASNSAIEIDARGYAVASNLSPYRMNEVMLDPQGLSANVELDDARLQVAPRAGAVVPLKFKTSTGQAHLLQLSKADGAPVPFGAEVLDASGRNVGYVGQGGQALVRLAGTENGALSARWGDGGRQCAIDWKPAGTGAQADATLQAVPATCRAL
ncbi:fimbria/pilus outer membrane usher protein [Variovorax ureilyticus]|uniref:Fimbria/pilus outer membrane usher protein n=1 Tax=Variovorax ureilyticus TaxID=1836198 RepID=A0ABU8VG76_9BURK